MPPEPSIGKWHRKFAWMPVPTPEEGWKWLCYVERRRIQRDGYTDMGPWGWWQYRVIQKGALPPE